MQGYTVCLCFGREKCEQETKAIAERNGTEIYTVEPMYPMYAAFYYKEPAYKGQIFLPKKEM